MLDDPKSFTGSKTAGQSPNAGWYNRFVQTGKPDHETKTNGCFGGQLHSLHILMDETIIYMSRQTSCVLCPITHVHWCATIYNQTAAICWYD